MWNRTGELAKRFVELPSREGVPLTGVEPGPRSFQWRADQPATIVWVEALDGGDLKNQVPFRDTVRSLAAPFTAQPIEVAKTEWRYGGIVYTDRGVALLSENDRASRRTRTWILDGSGAPRKVWDRKQDAAYDNPGTPVARRDSGISRRRTRRRQRADHPEWRLHLPHRRGRLTGRRSAVPRSAEREDAAERAHLQVVVGVARIVRRAAERRDDALRHALRDTEGSAEPLRARRRRNGEAAGHAVQGSAAGDPRHPPPVRHLQAQGRRHAVRARSTCRPATARARKSRS